MCRMCGKAPECIAHALAECSSLAQTKHLERHNAALKVLFFEILRDLDLNETVPPWFSRIRGKLSGMSKSTLSTLSYVPTG